MMVRTYGRRNRGITRTYSDSFDDAVSDPFSLSQENNPSHQDFCNFPFPSQESSSHSSPFDPDPYSFDSSLEIPLPRKSKKPRNGNNPRPRIHVTSTLMEAQEFGEMMEHVDEVNFAIDGLKKGQPVRIRRASLLSLLSISGTAQQRRILRAQGMAKTIIDAILGLSFDDSPSNLAAAALFYVLTSDGLDEHLLESPNAIRFLIKLLKPIISSTTENKVRNIGSKLLALRKDSDILRGSSKLADSNSDAIVAKVQEILISCKDIKLHCGDNNEMKRPELNPKWIALLTMEKACLSKISFEDTSGTVRKTGGDFKEKFRELGGLDAVFEVAINCHAAMEGWTERSSPSQDAEDNLKLQFLVLLLKCLKIMENATFLSKDNQGHLLRMKGNSNSYGCRISFTKLILSVIKITSGLYLLQSSSSISRDGKQDSLSHGSEQASELALIIADCKVDNNEIISISSTSCCSAERSFSERSFNASQKSTTRLSQSYEITTPFTNDTSELRVHSSMFSSCSEKLKTSSDGPRTNFGLLRRSDCAKDATCDILVDAQDPFAFDEDDCQPTKWDLLYGEQKISRTRSIGLISRDVEDGCQFQLMSQEESSNDENCQQKSSNGNGKHHSLQKNGGDEEHSDLLADCLLTAVKVLMNLTNENSIGCQQIAACGGLEIISSLIANHFPSFSSSVTFLSEEDTSNIEHERHKDNQLTDQELDFLVAILGLLVNLVEKDERNRSRLAAATVPLRSSEELEEENRRDIIPLLCSIFLANQGAGDASGEGSIESWSDEAALLQGEKEAEKMILEAYAALLLAFLSTESKSTRNSIADCLPNHNLAILVPVLERFVEFHLALNMIPPETHKAVNEVIESCRMP